MKKRLVRYGNALHVRLTRDLMFALGLENASLNEPPEVELELVEGGLLVKPVGVATAAAVPPVGAIHPETRAVLLAVRDQGPVGTVALAEHLGHAPQSVTRSLQKARADGWVERGPLGWTLGERARAWFSHVPVQPRTIPPSIHERALELVKRRGPIHAREVVEALGTPEVTTYNALRMLWRNQLVESTPEGYRVKR